MRPLLHFDSGFPTALPNHVRLAAMLAAHGEPRIIQRGAFSTYLEWAPLYPGVPVPCYTLTEPWPFETPRRALVRVTLDGAE